MARSLRVEAQAQVAYNIAFSPHPPPVEHDAVTIAFPVQYRVTQFRIRCRRSHPLESKCGRTLPRGGQRNEIEQARVDLIKDGLGCVPDVRRRCRNSVARSPGIVKDAVLIPFITPDSRNTGQPNHIPAPVLA